MARLIRIHEAKAVEEDLKDALGIVASLDPPEALRGAVFNLAAQALMQRVVEQPQAVNLAGLGLPPGRGRH